MIFEVILSKLVSSHFSGISLQLNSGLGSNDLDPFVFLISSQILSNKDIELSTS